MALNIELYEALKGRVGEKAARMVAEALPRGDELVTEAVLDQKLRELRLELSAEMQRLRADIRGWMLAFFVPLWIGVYGTILTLILKL